MERQPRPAEWQAADPELVVLSLDKLRAKVSPYGDESDQHATSAAVEQLHRQMDRHLAAGRRVLVDATNAHAADRQALLRIADRHQAATTAAVVLPPLTDVLARNATRSPVIGACGSARRVPEHTVTAMHQRIAADLHHLTAEGWRRIISAAPRRIRLSRAAGARIPPTAVSVAYPSRYRNPFRPTHRTPAANAAAVTRFREYVRQRPELIAAARRDLADRDLACWCADGLPCHASDVWIPVVAGEHP